MIRLLRISFLVILAAGIATAAESWMGGKGPGNQGVFPEVAFPQAPAVVWKAFLGNDFRNLLPSNTLVVGEQVIVAYDKFLLSLSKHTGEPLWKYDLYEPPQGDMLLLDGKIIVSTQHGFVFAIDPAEGKLLWKCRLTDSIRNNPVQTDGVLLYTTKSNTIEMVNYRATRDEDRWKILLRVPNKIEASPVLLGKQSLLCFADGTLIRLEESGINRWEMKLPNTVLGLTPATNGRLVVITTANGIFGINPFEREASKAVRWSHNYADRVNDSVVLSGDRVYAATRSGALLAIDAATGKDVWPAGQDGAATPQKPGIQLPAPPVAQPVVLGQHLLVRMEYGLVGLYDKNTGEAAWMYKMMPPTGAGVPQKFFAGLPAIVGDDIYFAGTDTVVYRLSKGARDFDPPAFFGTLPLNADKGYVVAAQLRFVGAIITDEGVGMHGGMVKMKLDDQDLTAQVQHDARSGYYYAPLYAPLEKGLHRLTITAKDYRGNEGTLDQSFIVASGNADFVEVQIGGEYLPKALQVKPGTVVSWRNNAGGPRTVVSDPSEEGVAFSSDDDYANGIPNKERWAWIVPEDIEPGTLIFYHCRLMGEAGKNGKIGAGLAGVLQVVDESPIATPGAGYVPAPANK